MGWKKKELPTYPALGFVLGEFITHFTDMAENQKSVKNTMYYENGKVVAGFDYNEKKRIFERSISQYTEMAPEEVLKEIEELNKKEMEKDLADIPVEVPSEEDIENMKDNS
jgi:uncharacterized protein YkuJ